MDGEHASGGDIDCVKKLKRQLEPWREIVLNANNLLTWEKPFYPGVLAGFVTFVYLFLWYMDMSNLTMYSLLGALLVTMDYAVPLITPKVFDANKWSGSMERQFEEICERLSKCTCCTYKGYTGLRDAKETKPTLFVVIGVMSLLTLAWIGSVFDGMFLGWLISLIAVMVPGLKHHGLIDKHMSQISSMISSKFKKN